VSVVGLGYHDFDDRADYEESFKPVVDRKLREVDDKHLETAGVEIEREVATDGGQPQAGPGEEIVDGEVYEYPFSVVDYHGETVREGLHGIKTRLRRR